MKTNLVNKTLIMLFLITISCSSSKQNSENSICEVFEKEIERNLLYYKDKKVYFKYDNRYLESFLNEYKNDTLIKYRISSRLEEELVDEIFNLNEIGGLLSQLKSKRFKTNKIKYPKNIIVLDKIDKEKDFIEEYTRINMILSKPVIISNNQVALINYSIGVKNSLSGGISVYVKKDNNWHFHTTINDWIE